MACSLSPTATATLTVATPLSSSATKFNKSMIVAFASCQPAMATCRHNNQGIHRRSLTLGLLSGVMPGLILGTQSSVAARRAPPPPPEERKDPNVSGVQAKVQASKKRKEAMKEAMAKLRERGKPIIPKQPQEQN